MIAGHLHNTRCMWIKYTGKKFGVTAPEQIDRYSVFKSELVDALAVNSEAIENCFKTVRKALPLFPDFPWMLYTFRITCQLIRRITEDRSSWRPGS